MNASVGQPARKKRSVEVEDYLSGIYEKLGTCQQCATELALHVIGPQPPEAIEKRARGEETPLPEYFMDRVLAKLSTINGKVLELRDTLTRVVSEF